jgi:hypothetical protein
MESVLVLLRRRLVVGRLDDDVDDPAAEVLLTGFDELRLLP